MKKFSFGQKLFLNYFSNLSPPPILQLRICQRINHQRLRLHKRQHLLVLSGPLAPPIHSIIASTWYQRPRIRHRHHFHVGLVRFDDLRNNIRFGLKFGKVGGFSMSFTFSTCFAAVVSIGSSEAVFSAILLQDLSIWQRKIGKIREKSEKI